MRSISCLAAALAAPLALGTAACGDAMPEQTILDEVFDDAERGDVNVVPGDDDDDDGGNGDGDADGADEQAQVYLAVLRPLNPDVAGDVVGAATFVSEGGELVAAVEADGLDDTIHPQHIHAADACPDMTADANGDGFVDVVEGVPSYGPILLPLDETLAEQYDDAPTDFPEGMEISYRESASRSALLENLRAEDPDPEDNVVKLAEGEELNLVGRTVVIHGVAEDLPDSVQTLPGLPNSVTLPIACGEIVSVTE